MPGFTSGGYQNTVKQVAEKCNTVASESFTLKDSDMDERGLVADGTGCDENKVRCLSQMLAVSWQIIWVVSSV